jgi:hypothetical protein
MHVRPIRTLIAIMATLGLVGAMAAIPVAAQTSTPTCEVTADGSTTDDVTDGVALTFDADFACTDADTTGTWSIVVNVANDSDTDVIIESVELSHATPPFGDDDANTADGDSLPLAVPAGAESSFDVDGAYELLTTDEGGLVNLHLRAAGVTDDDEAAPFALGITVHVLGPGVELDDENGADAGEGRPSWAPGPPPWVIEILRGIFGDVFPWGTDTFPPADDGADADANADPGPPAGLTLPPPAAGHGDDDEDAADAGAPSWVNPGGPPAWVPGGDDAGADDDAGPPAGAGRP